MKEFELIGKRAQVMQDALLGSWLVEGLKRFHPDEYKFQMENFLGSDAYSKMADEMLDVVHDFGVFDTLQNISNLSGDESEKV